MERIGSTNEKEQMNEQKESKTQAPDEESILFLFPIELKQKMKDCVFNSIEKGQNRNGTPAPPWNRMPGTFYFFCSFPCHLFLLLSLCSIRASFSSFITLQLNKAKVKGNKEGK